MYGNTHKPVRGELVEPLSFSYARGKEGQPFDRLRANGVCVSVTLRRDLLPYPFLPPGPVRHVRVSIERKGAALSVVFAAAGDIGKVRIPPAAEPRRADGLWQHTCFEMFVRRPGEERYFEFNFSPSGEWAASAFDGYRSGMHPFDIQAPSIGSFTSPDAIEALVSVPLPPQEWEVGLCAVIEDALGEMSYWALAHPSDKPDFHHPESLALHLPGPAT